MTQILNWLVLIAFSAGGIVMAHRVTTQSYARWTGPKNAVSLAFLYVLTLAAITGISFVATTVFYNLFLDQGAFIELVGVTGIVKFVAIYAGVAYAAVYATKIRAKNGT